MSTTNCVNMGVSLDGFIAREDGSIDWLNEANAVVPEGEDAGFGEFFARVDALVMGRNSFDTVAGFGFWPYGDKPVIIMTRRDLALPEHVPAASVSTSAESPEALCQRLAGEGMQRLYIDGGALIQAFLKAGLIHEITLTTVPVLIGRGISLFGDLGRDVQLEHVATQAFDFGFVQSQYRLSQA